MKTGIKLMAIVAMLFATTEVMAQKDCGSMEGKDTILIQKNVGMFGQYYQQKKYIDAYPYWNYLFRNAPCESKRITFNGAYIAKKHLLHLKKTDKAAYDTLKNGLVDTILMTYDARIKHWGDKWPVLAKKAADMYKLRPAMRDSAMKLFHMSVDTLGNKTDYLTAKYFMQSAVKEHKKGNYSLDSLFELYFKLQQIIDYNLENDARKKAKWVGSDTIVTKMMRPYFTCEKIEEFFKPKTDAGGEDVELLKKVTNLLEIAKCNNTDYALDIAIKSYELEPTGTAAISIAKSYLGKGDKDNAESWFKKGLTDVQDSTELEGIYQTLSSIAYSQSRFSEAKTNANKVLAINPNNGAAHLVVASSYIKSKGACTADNIDGKSVYWAAVDRAVKAKTVDPSVTEQANKFINTYTALFVTQTDAFFKNFPVQEGGSFTVPCLGVSTTVRFKK